MGWVAVPCMATLALCSQLAVAGCLSSDNKNIGKGRSVVCIGLAWYKLRESVCEEEVFALVFAIFLFLRRPISNVPLQHFTCWLVPILQMLPCHRGNISPEIISMTIWHSLCKLHVAVACKIVCRNHLALIKS